MGLRHNLSLLSLAPPSTPATNRSAARRARLLLRNRHQPSAHLAISGHLRSVHCPSAQPDKDRAIGTGGLPRMVTLSSLPRLKSHHRAALPYREVTEALETVEASEALLAAKLCLRFLVLTAARSGEARGATWDEIDEVMREWRIPAERMKGGVQHRMPLSKPALKVLEQASPLHNDSGLVFPSPVKPGHPMSDMTLTKVLRATGLAARATVHGFRSTFRDWVAECTNAPHAVIELSLAHAVGSSVEQAHARSDLIAKRRELLDQWAAFLTNSPTD